MNEGTDFHKKTVKTLAWADLQVQLYETYLMMLIENWKLKIKLVLKLIVTCQNPGLTVRLMELILKDHWNCCSLTAACDDKCDLIFWYHLQHSIRHIGSCTRYMDQSQSQSVYSADYCCFWLQTRLWASQIEILAVAKFLSFRKPTYRIREWISICHVAVLKETEVRL